MAWLILLTVQGVLPIATVYLTRDLVNRLVNAPLADLSATLTLVVLLALTLLLSQTLGGLNDWV
ncbi:MAG: ABC transporter ATP-binding protein, partial [Chloroflexota bacterium]